MKAKHLALVLSVTLASTLTGFAAGALQEGMAPKPTEQHEWMKRYLGTWEATVTVMGSESPATCIVRSLHGGLWNISEFEGSMMGAPFTGTELLGYDPEKKTFITVWVDSTSATFSTMEGHYDAEADKLVMKGESIGMDGQPAVMTNVTEFPTKDTMVYTMNVPGPDGVEFPMMTIDYKRKK